MTRPKQVTKYVITVSAAVYTRPVSQSAATPRLKTALAASINAIIVSALIAHLV